MKGLIAVFYEPGKVFDYVREHRAWVVAFFAGLILFAASLAYIYQEIGAGNITRHSLDESRFAAQMTPEQKAQAVAQADTTAGKARNIAFACVGYAVVMMVFGLLFMAIAGASGHGIKFSQAMGTVSYSSWPFSVLRFILSIVVIAMAADKTELDPQHLLAFNLGAFLDKATTAKPLYALGSAFDLFTFAQMALAAFGLSKVAQISFTKALVGMILIWVVFTLIGMGFSLLL